METNQDLKDRIVKLEMILHGMEQANLSPHVNNQSFNISELAKSLSKAQAEFKPISQNRSNPFFKSKYADLDSILKAVRPALAKHGLSFYQYTSIDNGKTILHSRILHTSGQWVESQTNIAPPKADIQSYGSTMSYQRRYSAITLLGVATTDDPFDDDGNSVSIPVSKQKINASQTSELKSALKGKDVLLPVILKKLSIDSLEEMKQYDFKTIMGIIKNYKG